jgi:hypothetical protein
MLKGWLLTSNDVAVLCATDDTYGVVCEPAPGSLDNLHSAKPWLTTTSRNLRPIGKSMTSLTTMSMS